MLKICSDTQAFIRIYKQSWYILIGKPLFELCSFHMSISKIDLNLFSTFSGPYFSSVFLHCQNELKSAQTILASVLTPPLDKKLPI